MSNDILKMDLVSAWHREQSHEELSSLLGRLECGGVSAGREVKGMLRERMMADQQTAEIRQIWPSMSYRPK